MLVQVGDRGSIVQSHVKIISQSYSVVLISKEALKQHKGTRVLKMNSTSSVFFLAKIN